MLSRFRFPTTGATVMALALVGLAIPLAGADLFVELTDQGGRIDCSGAGLIAFDRLGSDGCYALWTMNADGSRQHLLLGGPGSACDHRNLGNPAWDPSGRYLAFECEKAHHPAMALSSATTPGIGVCNDLYILDTVTGLRTLVRSVPEDASHGILHPHFSRDGTKLSWSEMWSESNLFVTGKEFGYWRLMSAPIDLTAAPRPLLGVVSDHTPGVPGFYENHGFTPDGGGLIFSCNTVSGSATRAFSRSDICLLDLASGRWQALTDSGYNEHAQFSPDGTWIAWMSNVGSAPGTEYWLMHPDGSQKRQLTSFNSADAAAWHHRAVPSDCSWTPDGRSLIGYVQIGTPGLPPAHELILRLCIDVGTPRATN